MQDEDDFDFETPGESGPPDTDESLGVQTTVKGLVVSKSKLCEVLGLAPVTVDKLFKEGAPVLQANAGRLGWKINTAEFIAWLRRRDVFNATGDPDAQSFDNAKTREKQAQAELREYELKKLKGETVTIEEAARIYAQEISDVRAGLFAIPTAYAQRLSTISDPAEVARVLKDALADSLSRLVEKPNAADWNPDDENFEE
jgi:phage terminase Nu1 subunit (DNA packaging protein)